MSGEQFGIPGADQFTRFWGDFVGRLSANGVAPPSNDAAEAWRKAFFAAMTDHLDSFMRSEQFLAAMKQSMEGALAWQQTMNQALQKGLSAAQMPSRADTDHMVRLIRGMEDRLVDRLEELCGRVEALEKGAGAKAPRSAKR
ncbi:MAG: hypothetical protein KDA32_01805 [Phycisphaerales bacterium]|nr:hypothetical protein [Phycisphaerales bacterium]